MALELVAKWYFGAGEAGKKEKEGNAGEIMSSAAADARSLMEITASERTFGGAQKCPSQLGLPTAPGDYWSDRSWPYVCPSSVNVSAVPIGLKYSKNDFAI